MIDLKNVIPTVKYVWLTIKHKYFVLRSGLRIGVPIYLLIAHDLSKFSIKEVSHYGRQFYGDMSDSQGFMRAWLHHQNTNPHHWEYWVPRTGHNRCIPTYTANLPLEMPEIYVKEMVADWLGASRAYTGKYPESLKKWEWFQDNFNHLNLHNNTRALVLDVLYDYFWECSYAELN